MIGRSCWGGKQTLSSNCDISFENWAFLFCHFYILFEHELVRAMGSDLIC